MIRKLPARSPRKIVTSLPTEHQALLVQINMSGKTDAEICGELGMKPPNFSRFRSGKLNFPINSLNDSFGVCGNRLLLEYLAYSQGCELVPMQEGRSEQRVM